MGQQAQDYVVANRCHIGSLDQPHLRGPLRKSVRYAAAVDH